MQGVLRPDFLQPNGVSYTLFLNIDKKKNHFIIQSQYYHDTEMGQDKGRKIWASVTCNIWCKNPKWKTWIQFLKVYIVYVIYSILLYDMYIYYTCYI